MAEKDWEMRDLPEGYWDTVDEKTGKTYMELNHERAMNMVDALGFSENMRQKIDATQYHEATIEEPYGFIKEGSFYEWYSGIANKLDLDKDPDHYKHYYDYRAAHKAGAKLSKDNHLPSEFKHDLHPDRYIVKDAQIYDSKNNMEKATIVDKLTQAMLRKEFEEQQLK